MPNLWESGIRNPGNFCLWNPESNKFLLRNPESSKVLLRNPESSKVLLRNPECWKIYASGIREIFASQSGILGFGIWNTAQGIRNPTNDSNPESASSIDKVFGRNPVPGIRNPWPGIQNPRLSRIPIHGLVKGSSVFLQHFQLLFLHRKKSYLSYT